MVTREAMKEFVTSPFYDHWRSRVESTRGCAAPIRLAACIRWLRRVLACFCMTTVVR